MPPIVIYPPVLHSVNMTTVAEANAHRPTQEKSLRCDGKLSVPDVCTAICDSIFSGTKDPKKEKEMAQKIFSDSCDSVCQCICDTICDGIV